MKQFQDLVTFAPWTFIFQICNLLILTLGVKHFLFKPVQKILKQRSEQVESLYTEAEKAEGDANALKAEYETRLASARQEATEIVQTATQRAAARSDEMVNAAKAEAAAIRKKADAEIESERRRAASELRAGPSASPARRFLRAEGQPSAAGRAW